MTPTAGGGAAYAAPAGERFDPRGGRRVAIRAVRAGDESSGARDGVDGVAEVEFPTANLPPAPGTHG